MLSKKLSRTTHPVLDLYTARPLANEEPAPEGVNTGSQTPKDEIQTAAAPQEAHGFDENHQEGAPSKGAQSHDDPTPKNTDDGESTSSAPDQNQPIVLPSQMPSSPNSSLFSSSEKAAEQQALGGADGFGALPNTQDHEKPSGPGTIPGFDPAEAPTHSIGGNNLQDLMDYFGNVKWGGAAFDIWSGVEITVVTYKFAEQVSQLRGWMQDDIAYTNDFGQKLFNFSAFGNAQITGAEEALNRWEEVSNIRFLEVDADHKADITFFGFDFQIIGVPASGQSSGVDESDGAYVKLGIAPDFWNAIGPGEFGTFTLIHEIGHAIGLPHPGDYDLSDEEQPTYWDDAEYIQDTLMYTVMSYFQEEFTGGEWGPDDNLHGNYANLATIQTHDMYVIQQKYGINWDTFFGDTTYGYNSNTNTDAYDFTVNSPPVIAIWDGGGYDTLDLSGDGSGVFLDLRPGAFSSTHGLTHNISITYEPDETKAGHNAVIEAAVGGAGDDYIIGNTADNLLRGRQGDDRLEGRLGNDNLRGGLGNDRLIGGEGNDDLEGGAGADELDGGNGNDDLHGGNGGDILGGGDGDDDLFGNNGDDLLLGGDGDDFLVGGQGDDTLNGGAGTDDLNGGDGFDTADYSYASSDLEIDLAAVLEDLDENQIWGWATRDHVTYEGVFNIEHVMSGAGDDVIYGSSLRNILEGGNGDDRLYGRDGRDNLEGGNGDDRLFGGRDRDTLNGGNGNDLLRGGQGLDTLLGGKGTDTADYLYSNANWTISLTFGTATNGGSDTDVLSGIENVRLGAGHDTVRGNGTSNLLDGGGGSDSLTGLAGNDILLGDTGNDVLNGGTGNDILAGGAGIDTADYSDEFQGVRVDLSITSQQDTVGAGLDTLTGIEDLIGSQHNDWLFGDDKRNVIEGGFGDDNLFGRGGDDLIWGREGNDILLGGLGDDILVGGDGIDTASYLFAVGGVRVDLSIAGSQNTLSDGLDALASIENISGSLHHDILFGDEHRNRLEGLDGNDLLSGMAGDDVLFGGAGNDTLAGGAGNDVLEGGSGIDWAIYTSAVVVNLNQETQNTYGAGIDTLRDIENLSGSIHGDALGGDDGQNEINGNGGNDWLFGRAGNDTLRGGAGDDFIAGNRGSDNLFGGAGVDTFIFDDDWGNDTIHDFVVGQDILDFGLVSGVENLNDFHISESAGSAVIGFGFANSVTLIGISVSELNTSDWVL